MLKLLRFACILFFASSAYATDGSLNITDVEPETEIRNLIWEKRLVLVFSNSNLDPKLKQQIEMFTSDPNALLSRDVQVFVDHTPESNSNLRKRFRPKGFLIILIGKDGQIKLRKNTPWSAREITRVIDKGS